MKSHLCLALALALLGCAGIDPPAESSGRAKAATQLDLNQSSSDARVAADADLKKFISTFKQHLSPSQVSQLEKAQSAWEQFRHDACAFESSGTEGGSAYPAIYGQCLTQSAKRRLKDMRALASCEEGDLACPAPGPLAASTLAWWLTIELQARETTWRGLAASALSTPMKRLSPLSCHRESDQFSASQCQEVRANKMRFRVSGDFNGDGRQEIAETAVAQLEDGALVSALIISSRQDPREHQVFYFRGNGFSVLYLDGNHLEWNDCMECGHAISIRWDSKRRTYLEVAPAEYGAETSTMQSSRTRLVARLESGAR